MVRVFKLRTVHNPAKYFNTGKMLQPIKKYGQMKQRKRFIPF